MAIAPQPATTPSPHPTRPAPARKPAHRMMPVDVAPRTLTLTKLAGLITVTALGLALAGAVAFGAAAFAVLNIHG